MDELLKLARGTDQRFWVQQAPHTKDCMITMRHGGDHCSFGLDMEETIRLRDVLSHVIEVQKQNAE